MAVSEVHASAWCGRLYEVTEADLKGHNELPQSVYPLRNGTAKTAEQGGGQGGGEEGVVSML